MKEAGSAASIRREPPVVRCIQREMPMKTYLLAVFVSLPLGVAHAEAAER